MKHIFYLITLLFTLTAGAQTLTEIQKLDATARIWGFLKYYHPQVAAGKYNWDNKLVQVLPLVKQAQTKDELSTVFLNWIEEQGNVPVCKKCAKVDKESFDKNFDMSWMQDTKIFTPELSAKLKYIENNRLLGDKYYVSPKGKGGSLGITNEVTYNNFNFPPEEGRLLTLFRFWNTIEYFAPYKYMTDVKWGDVLRQSIPKFTNARDTLEYQFAINELIATTDDSHGTIFTQANMQLYGAYRPPFVTTLVEDKIIVTKLHNDSLCRIDDIRVGDVISHLDGKVLIDLFKANYKYYCASNKAVKNRHIEYILCSNNNVPKITFERNGVIAEKEIHEYKPRSYKYDVDSNDKGYRILAENIGYANLSKLFPKDVDAMMESLSKCPAIIFDIRNYPQWSVHELCAKLTPDGKEFVKLIKADLDYPGRFHWQPSLKTKSGRNPYTGKVIVLVNEDTQSRSEFTTMAIKAATNATVVGSQTAGADGELIYVELPGDFTATFTGTGIFYPDGRETQRAGIVPDIEVHPTIAGIRAGKDEVLNKAIEIAKQ